MPNWRRAWIPGGTFFFTVVADGRFPLFADAQARALLGEKFRLCQQRWPFDIVAIVLLPDHLHTIWSMPRGDTAYSNRWAWIKSEFTKAWLRTGGSERSVSDGRRRDQRRGVWQPKYWEHTLEDEENFERHFDYIHYNPVKHGHVRCPHDWEWSSFHRYVRLGVYPEHWACWESHGQTMSFEDIEDSVGE